MTADRSNSSCTEGLSCPKQPPQFSYVAFHLQVTFQISLCHELQSSVIHQITIGLQQAQLAYPTRVTYMMHPQHTPLLCWAWATALGLCSPRLCG